MTGAEHAVLLARWAAATAATCTISDSNDMPAVTELPVCLSIYMIVYLSDCLYREVGFPVMLKASAGHPSSIYPLDLCIYPSIHLTDHGRMILQGAEARA